jgi:hypothetical protein
MFGSGNDADALPKQRPSNNLTLQPAAISIIDVYVAVTNVNRLKITRSSFD